LFDDRAAWGRGEPATSGVTGLRANQPNYDPALVLLLTSGRRRSDISAEIDGLFQRSLAEFTEARNALAKHLKNDGRTLAAERVKALAKPPWPAWAANQLSWEDPIVMSTPDTTPIVMGSSSSRRMSGRQRFK
jgi:hypothetical protein